MEREEIRDFVSAVISGAALETQLASLLMAILLKGMDFEETVDLTREMAHQGRSIARNQGRIRIGKHSTGGVGDKTTLILGPAMAGFGLEVSLMCGRSLGHTGGTVDKLGGLRGLRTALKPAEIRAILRRHGFCFFEQTAELAPADRRIYALRDQTATVESLPLICSSILSKKWAEGLDGVVLDVKFGSGSFMGPLPRARTLALLLLRVAKKMGLKATAVLSSMEQPLGQAVGNNLELLESVETLRGHGPADVTELAYILGREMLSLAHPKRKAIGAEEFREHLTRGDLTEILFRGLRAQGGDRDDPRSLRLPTRPVEVRAPRSGWVQGVEARAIGEACMALGAGRLHPGAAIDPTVGIGLLKKSGDRVKKGEVLAEVFAAPGKNSVSVRAHVQKSFRIGNRRPRPAPLVISVLKNH